MLLLLAVAAAARDHGWCAQKGGTTHLEYLSNEALVAAEAKRADNERRGPRPIDGSLLLIQVQRWTLETADPANQLILVFDSAGAEIARVESDHSIPRAPDHPGYGNCDFGCWRSVISVPVEAPVPLTVRVADKAMASHCDWTVDEKGRVK